MIKNLIIVGLLTINGSFVWYFLQQVSQEPNPSVALPVAQAPVATSATTTEVTPSTETLTKPETSEQSAIPEITSDYNQLTAQLRAQGYEEELIRQILLSTINRDHLLLQAYAPPEDYWKGEQQSSVQEIQEQLGYEDQRRLLLRQLFGDDIVNDPLFVDIFKPLNDSLPFLSSDKQIAINSLQKLHEAEGRDAFLFGYTREDREDRIDARQEMTARVQELLTAEEFFEYELRESRLAGMMQRSVESFDFTEQEFREVFAIRKQNEGTDFTNFQDREQWRQQRETSNNQIRDYLGPERYAEYARAQDPAYRALMQIGDRYGNSEDEIIKIYELTSEAENEISALRDRDDLEREERLELMNEVRSDVYEKVVDIAGEETAQSVQNNQRRLFRPRRTSP